MGESNRLPVQEFTTLFIPHAHFPRDDGQFLAGQRPLKQLDRSISRAVIVEMEMSNTNSLVKTHPLRNVTGFIFHAGDDRNAVSVQLPLRRCDSKFSRKMPFSLQSKHLRPLVSKHRTALLPALRPSRRRRDFPNL